MDFAKHLFISYAHIDNDVVPGVPLGWIDHLQAHLEVRLAQLLGERPTIWRDKAQLGGNRVFKDTIGIGLKETAVFLSVLSPRYLKSSSCREEWEGFLDIAQQHGGVRIGDRHRIFKVIKTHVEFDQHPEPIRDLLGYEFYAQHPITKKFQEFDHDPGFRGESYRRYLEKLDDLAQDICALLKEMQGVDAPKPGATIFLAETTSDLAEQRDKVRRELKQDNHIILPDQPLPRNRPQLETFVLDCLQRSRLSVHLIGANYGSVPEMEPERSVDWLQEELARKRGDNAEFSRLIWLPPGLEPKDDRQRRFIETLQNTFHSTNGSDLIQTNIEGLKTIIQAKLNPPPKPTVTERPKDSPKCVYLVCDQRDLEDTEHLYNYLSSKGFKVFFPEFEENVMQAHIEYVLNCDAVLFYFDKAPERWLQTQLENLTSYGRARPFDALGVFITGAETFKKKIFQTPEVRVMKNFGAFDPSSLKPFMQQLTQAQGGAQ
jgi:hypothetical protein